VPQAGPLEAGWEALKRDDLKAAEQIARAALARSAHDGEALYLLGSSLLFQNRFAEALAPLDAALRTAPRRGMGHRLGYCQLALGEFRQAEELLRREVEAYPDLIDAWNALGVALINQSRLQEALEVFLEAARRDPRSAVAHTNVANVLGDLGRGAEALPHLQQAVALDPGLADARYNLGVLLHGQKRHEEAIDSLEQALRLAPAMTYALSHLVWNELAICRWEKLPARIEALRAQVRSAGNVVEPFTFLAVSHSAEEQRLCAERYVQDRLPARPAPLWQGTRYRHDRIRLAYLSADYHEHATAYLAAGLFERHDRARFELIGVSYGPDDASPMRERLMRAFDRFVDVRSRSDEEIARMLLDLEVDIAVDLKGHTTGSRPGILAHRPAPIQAAYLGYPGTMGAPFIDYLLADRCVIPHDEQRFYTEKVVYLPGCYQVNDARRAIAPRTPSRAEAGLPGEGFVFCCFNNNYKILPPVFGAWMRLLRDVPQSVLWLLEDNAAARRNLQEAARTRGVDPARLVFAPRLPPAEHLARHRVADLFLDTLPCNAHTTASDALWAGLPVLTCAGTTFAGRVAASVLSAAGLDELVTRNPQEYEALALALARDPRLLAGLREKLARSLPAAPLFDTDLLCRGLEAAYAAMWQSWQRGEPPVSFTARPGG
jgi:predicted O-linked N-acetylglucosamine transferase (SPINDLY family)